MDGIVINAAFLNAAKYRWMTRFAKGQMGIRETAEKMNMLPRNREGFACLWMYLSNIEGDSDGWEVLVDDYWQFLTLEQKKYVVQKVRFIFAEETWRGILWHIPSREERMQLLLDTDTDEGAEE